MPPSRVSPRPTTPTPSQIALAWLLRRSAVVPPIPDTSRRDHLEEHVAAAAIALSDEEYSALSR